MNAVILIPRPGQYALLLTSKCNLRCERCISGIDGPGEHMKDEVLDKALELIEKTPYIHTVRLSGGEPTLHPRFFEVARRLARQGKRVIVYTNGHWAKSVEDAEEMYEQACPTRPVDDPENPKGGWVDFRLSYNADLLKVQPDQLQRIANVEEAARAHAEKMGYRDTRFSVSIRGDTDSERMDLRNTLVRSVDGRYKMVNLPFVKAGKSKEGIRVNPRKQAKESYLLLVHPNGDVFASRVEAHEALGSPGTAGKSRVGNVMDERFRANAAKGNVMVAGRLVRRIFRL